MINLSEAAQKALDNYLKQVRTCLQGSKTVDADEVEQNVRDHIESELAEAAEPVSDQLLNAVLTRLGSPSQWVPEEEIPWWRKTVSRLRTGPEDWRLAYISFALLVLGLLLGRLSFHILLLASFIISRAVLSVANAHRELRAQKWLIYPSLVIVYLFLLFWLLTWPVFPSFVVADGFEHLDKDVFPWNSGEAAYWGIAFMFIAAVTSFWWLILALIYKKCPRLFHATFRPFAEDIRTEWVNRLMGIASGLLIISLIGAVLMLRYQGWYIYLREIMK